MNTRIKKQIIIALIFFALLFFIGLFFYFIFGFNKTLPQPDFSISKEPEIIWVKFFKVNPIAYDFGAQIKNPNLDKGAPILNYAFNLFDDENNLINSINDRTYLLPGEEKYLIKNRVELLQAPSKVVLTFKNIEWQFLPEDQNIKQNFPIFYPRFNILKKENNFAEASGLLINKTDYNFVSMQASIVLYDFNNEPQAVNRTELNNVHAGEERLAQFNWRESFSENISNVDIQVNTNLFSKENVF